MEMGKFPRGRVTVVGILGGMSKFEGKAWISRVVNAKRVKNSRGSMIKLTENPGESTSKNLISSTVIMKL